MKVLDRRHSIAPPGFNRWLVPPAALAVHLSIGQAYAFSVFKIPLTQVIGVDHHVPGRDWEQPPLAWIFSIAMAFLGISAAAFGKWIEREGPRKAMFASACCFTLGFFISSLGVRFHQLWMLYVGYGVIGGIGLGLGYISPVSTLIKWFVDRPGMATGMAIMGFGGGAMIGGPLAVRLMNYFAQPGDNGVAMAMFAMGGIYFIFMMFGAFLVRVPPDGWLPPGYVPRTNNAMITSSNLDATVALRTPQFWLLWVVLFCNVTAGIGILEQASPMIQDFFSDVDAAAAAGFVGVLSLCNMSGRFVWSSTSDVVGRKRIYMMYLGVGALLYFLLATMGTASIALFVLFTGIILSFYGGGFATVPAYLKDLFGTLEVGAIHGRLLTAWSAAGVAGPLIVNGLADLQEGNGEEGSGLYTLSLFIMVGVLVVGFIANLMIRPVDERFHVRDEERSAEHERAEDGDRFTREEEPARASRTATTTTGSES